MYAPDLIYIKLSSYAMLYYYLKRAIRGIRKQPVISAINILGLSICTIIMLRQLHYLQTQNPGFNKKNVLVVKATGVDDPARTLRASF